MTRLQMVLSLFIVGWIISGPQPSFAWEVGRSDPIIEYDSEPAEWPPPLPDDIEVMGCKDGHRIEIECGYHTEFRRWRWPWSWPLHTWFVWVDGMTVVTASGEEILARSYCIDDRKINFARPELADEGSCFVSREYDNHKCAYGTFWDDDRYLLEIQCRPTGRRQTLSPYRPK